VSGSTRGTKIARGRFKTTGTGKQTAVRWQLYELKAIDEWRDMQGDWVSRPEAVRRLVEIGLGAELPARRRSPQAASKASELAGERVKKLLSPLLSEQERQARSRQLIRGPKEFRKMRKRRSGGSSDTRQSPALWLLSDNATARQALGRWTLLLSDGATRKTPAVKT
jgi:hypothetical protein